MTRYDTKMNNIRKKKKEKKTPPLSLTGRLFRCDYASLGYVSVGPSDGRTVRQSVRPSISLYFQTAKILVLEGGEILNHQQQQQLDNNKN